MEGSHLVITPLALTFVPATRLSKSDSLATEVIMGVGAGVCVGVGIGVSGGATVGGGFGCTGA